MTNLNLGDLAVQYHAALPRRLREYLHRRGLPDMVIDDHLLGWNGWRITIPIMNREGVVAFFNLAKDPDDERPGPKMLASPGGAAELYGWPDVLSQPHRIILCEGEFDRLVLKAHGFAAATSTGGVGTFRPEWAEEFQAIPDVYICFDRDEAGERAIARVARLIPHAKIVTLPDEVGSGGDVTDYLVRLGRSTADFEVLLGEATLVPKIIPAAGERVERPITDSSPLRERVEALKRLLPIEQLIGRSVALKPSGGMFVGLCPFHEDHVPSLTVYPQSRTFHCFGCRRGGDVIDFYREREQVGFREALEQLEDMAR